MNLHMLLKVRFVMKDAIRKQLELGNIVMLNNLGEESHLCLHMDCRLPLALPHRPYLEPMSARAPLYLYS